MPPHWFKKEEDKLHEEWEHLTGHDKEKVSELSDELKFLGGNKNNPVLVLGEEPDSEDGTKNLLVVKLGVAETVPADSVADETPVPETVVPVQAGASDDEIDAEIARLQAQKSSN